MKLRDIHRDDVSHDAYRPVTTSPYFWEGVSTIAWHNLWSLHELPSGLKWFVADIGRTSLTLAAGILNAQPEGFTLSGLYRFARRHRICSGGRVLLYFDTAVSRGWFKPDPSATRRVLQKTELSPALVELLRSLLTNVLHGLKRMEICDEAALVWIGDDANFRRAFAALGLAAILLPEPMVEPGSATSVMLGPAGGPRLLDALLISPHVDPAQGLSSPGTSRQVLAGCCGVSRTQLSRIVALGEEGGHLVVQDRSIRISSSFHEELQRQFTYLLGTTCIALQICGCPLNGARA